MTPIVNLALALPLGDLDRFFVIPTTAGHDFDVAR
jgi:hypothetical protein